MKTLAALSLALAVTAAAATGASAYVHEPEQLEAYAAHPRADVDLSHFDPCHGRTSGTAHVSCGTTTGGPAGGLF